MAAASLNEFISVLGQYADNHEIQIAIKHHAVFNVFTIPNFRLNSGKTVLMISSVDSRSNFQLTIEEIVHIEDVYHHEPKQWRSVAFVITCKSGVEIGINILTGS
ncbi:hypothetical protein [Peribacillus deserti]|uniref:Uncharacterized protein n=1 Tax=Peribacillus deserti TaxID=673318 RepID=A0A2N5M8X1_9BACI|nr:hypothetical protein [Peribacillus deserti]PLT30792.1 hypothetical protein CUU66_06470 [Peribacillus deserti]